MKQDFLLVLSCAVATFKGHFDEALNIFRHIMTSSLHKHWVHADCCVTRNGINFVKYYAVCIILQKEIHTREAEAITSTEDLYSLLLDFLKLSFWKFWINYSL